ncbi:MAG TPA: complex I NDUFA9 subunit family protein [Gammaproteobacteria bacterium]|jgi:NADH dehydrogenase|nr:complex I NDUFA9 subunit family protein [Gammaproteobacteria bacterium]
MSRICILGGTGFVGRHLAARLVARGHDVEVLTRHRFLHTDMLVLPTLTLVQADVYDPGVLREAFIGCDAVINLVGILNERGHKGRGFAEAHVTLTAAVLEACRGAGLRRLLHMSALNAEIHGPSHYLRTKGTAEQMVLAAKHLDATVFEPSVIFGPGDSFLRRFAGLAKRMPLVFPLAFPKARFKPVYVGDVTEAFVYCLENRAGIGQRYALCGPKIYTLRELVAYAVKLSARRRLILGLPRPVAWLQAAIMEWLPGKPFSLDNYHSLTRDNVSEDDGLAALHIRAKPLEAVAPLYLSGARHVR